MTRFLVQTSSGVTPTFDLQILKSALASADPAAVLIPPWLLLNIIAFDRGRGRSPFNVPHRKIHLIDRQRLTAIAHDQGWPLPPLPQRETLILLAIPQLDWLQDRPAGDILRHYWQMLFHARLDMELGRKMCEPSHDGPAIQSRIERMGRSAFNEACFVLHRERAVENKADEEETYPEFAATYLELHHFRPDMLPVYFPALTDDAGVLTVLREDIDDGALLAQTRLEGSAESYTLAAAASSQRRSPGTTSTGPGPAGVGSTRVPSSGAGSARPESIAAATPDAGQISGIEVQAHEAANLGNSVRAAILRRRIYLARAIEQPEAVAVDEQDIDILLNRLGSALQFSEGEKPRWRELLAALVADAAQSWWNADDRLLYDLQKICVHHEREIYSVNVVDWLLHFCHRPLRRPQPNQRLVLICKALRAAAEELDETSLSPAQQASLLHLLHAATHRAENCLRDALRPAVAASIGGGGLVAKNAPERVAMNKLTEELLDNLAHHGHLTLGGVRDAISSNQIKFDDIPGPRSFFTRDPLFQINRRLADSLDGVYHRGEVYRRLFQKVSSWAFATKIGRFITRTVLIPLGGSFIIIEGLDHTLFLVVRKITGAHWLKLSELEEFRREPLGHYTLLNLPFILLALILLGAVNWRPFRLATFRVLRGIAHGFHGVFIDAPRWIATQPAVLAAAKSRPTHLLMRYIVKPLAVACLVELFMPRHCSPRARWTALGVGFAVVNLLLNSRHGKALEQVAVHWLGVFGRHVTTDYLGSLFSAVMHFFARRLDDFERMLYAVDEWLRFREGQPRSSLWMRAGLGVFWFYIAYVARFVVNLLIEPQVNPIKHFPVVTVSHKIIFPTTWGPAAAALEQLGLSAARAGTLATIIVTGIPGIFGFLAWELRANWKLYRANRAKVLKPIAIGSHGETLARLLRPGFHSGTIPKLFAKLRRKQRKQGALDNALPLQKQEAVEHVTQAVSHFIEREFIYRLNQHPLWRDTPIGFAPGESAVRLGPTRIAVALACPAMAGGVAELCFEQNDGWIVAGFDHAGWVTALSPAHRHLFSCALLGLYKIAGVDLVKEQIKHLFSQKPLAFELSRQSLTVWQDKNFAAATICPLKGDNAGHAAVPDGLDLSKLHLRSVAIDWNAWVKVWDSETGEGSAGVCCATTVLPG